MTNCSVRFKYLVIISTLLNRMKGRKGTSQTQLLYKAYTAKFVTIKWNATISGFKSLLNIVLRAQGYFTKRKGDWFTWKHHRTKAYMSYLVGFVPKEMDFFKFFEISQAVGFVPAFWEYLNAVMHW